MKDISLISEDNFLGLLEMSTQLDLLYLALLPVMYCTVIEECVRDKEE